MPELQASLLPGTGLWSMEGLARHINQSIAGGTVDGLSASVVEGELRLSYERPASLSATVANTIEVASVASGLASLGFELGTYSGFVDGQKSVADLEWGLSQYSSDAGAAAVTIEVAQGANSGDFIVSLTTVVNTADMLSYVDIYSELMGEFDTSGADLRVDQVGSALVFTSTLLGTKHNNADSDSSVVTLTMTGTPGDVAYLSNKLGISEGTAKGSGDSNFKMFVVDNTPQFQLGADQGQSMNVAVGNMSAEALGVANIDLTNVKNAQGALAKINKAIDKVSAERSKMGSFQNRLEFAINNLRNTHSNLVSSESRIRDADIAMEMIEFTRNQIISQSGTAMLAQANMVPQGVLQLLK